MTKERLFLSVYGALGFLTTDDKFIFVKDEKIQKITDELYEKLLSEENLEELTVLVNSATITYRGVKYYEIYYKVNITDFMDYHKEMNLCALLYTDTDVNVYNRDR